VNWERINHKFNNSNNKLQPQHTLVLFRNQFKMIHNLIDQVDIDRIYSQQLNKHNLQLNQWQHHQYIPHLLRFNSQQHHLPKLWIKPTQPPLVGHMQGDIERNKYINIIWTTIKKFISLNNWFRRVKRI
jgi:hypothetical protein